MRIATWNVNGLRSAMRKALVTSLESLDADVIALQETKCQQHQLREPLLRGYSEHWNSATTKKGYSGTLLLTRKDCSYVTFELGNNALDGEGRVITASFDDFYLVNVYVPNAQSGLKRLPFRLDWDAALQQHLEDLSHHKPVILCGDLNVAHKEIDLANPQRNRGKSCFSHEERDSFERLLNLGFVDAFRMFEAGGGHYTFWRFNKGTREKNMGWRLDYFCISDSLQDMVADCYHRNDIHGSDHCPVVLELINDD
ncbi:MAG: exodeoxyribonuclease III [Pseudomonadota bacterium]